MTVQNTKSLRILLTIPNFRTAGSQYVLLSLYHLYKKRHPQTFILIEDASAFFPEEVDPGDRLILPKKGYLSVSEGISYSRKFAALIRVHEITVVHSWDYRSEIWEALACKMARVPYVYTKKNNAWSKKWWFKSLLSNHIVYDHPEMGSRFFNTAFLRMKASLIVHGVNPEVFKPSRNHKNRTHLIGCIGNIGANKNQLVLLRALAASKLPVQCHFYGNADPEYLKMLQEYIQSNNLQDRVVFKGYVENLKLPEVLNSLDILILASYNEGLPVILLEAMACGVYCIASDSGGGSRYILDNCKNGDIFKPDDYLRLSGLIQNFYSNPLPDESVAETSIKQIGENFSIQKEADQYLSLFGRL